MKAKKIAALALAGVMAFSTLLAGCGGESASQTGETGKKTSDSTEKSSGERKKITALLRCSETSTKYIILKKLLTEFSDPFFRPLHSTAVCKNMDIPNLPPSWQFVLRY